MFPSLHSFSASFDVYCFYDNLFHPVTGCVSRKILVLRQSELSMSGVNISQVMERSDVI